MKHSVLLLTGLALCFAAEPSIVADTIRDEFEQYIQVGTSNNELYGNSHNEQAYLDFVKYVDAASISYLLVLTYIGNGRLSITDGRSLFIKCDDTLISFEANSGSYRISYSIGMGIVRETMRYSVDADQMCRIAYAKSGRVKIRGWNKELVRTLGNKNFIIFRRFVDTVIDMKNDGR